MLNSRGGSHSPWHMVRTQQAAAFKNNNSIFSSFYPRSFCYPQLEQMLCGFPTVCYPGLSTGPNELSKVMIAPSGACHWSSRPTFHWERPKGSGSVQDCSSQLPLAEKSGRTPSKSSRNRTRAFFCLSWQDLANCLPEGVAAGLRLEISSGIVAGLTVGTLSLWKSQFPARLWDDGGLPQQRVPP